VVTRVCVSVCVSVRSRIPTLLHGPGCNMGSGRGCPLVVHCWTDLQSVHGLRCYGNITRTLVTSLRPSRVPAIWRHSANGRLGGVCTRCWPVTGGWRGPFSKLRAVYGKWAWLAGRWLAVDGGVLNITAAARTAGFQWWRSGDITRTQNVSEYMLVLALCLVTTVINKQAHIHTYNATSDNQLAENNELRRTKSKML